MTGDELYALLAELFPIPRSLTGDGVRSTLRRLQGLVPLEIHEVPSGDRIFDWIVPPEWNVTEAFIEAPDGRRVVDFADSSLHLVGYSVPIDAVMSLAELREHLHTLPDQPEAIPYRTSYYERTWGFCLPHALLEQMPPGDYRVVIDASLLDRGSLTYGEVVLPGASTREMIISAHVCHPALANDNLSGVVVATALARRLAERPRRHTFRFLFAPGTIGPLAWLARQGDEVHRIDHGLVLAGVGAAARPVYKRSRRHDAAIDRAFAHVLDGLEHDIVAFTPFGYDERQFCSPAFDLPVGSLQRGVWGTYPEYHTSRDNLSFVTPAALADTIELCASAIELLEQNVVPLRTDGRGEPQLSRHALDTEEVDTADHHRAHQAHLWVLNLADGAHDLLGIAETAQLPFNVVHAAAERLRRAGLLTAQAYEKPA